MTRGISDDTVDASRILPVDAGTSAAKVTAHTYTHEMPLM